jgi:serine/threonine protein kinase
LFHDESALRPGATVGNKLVIERLLGAGGMGIVYAATHSSLRSRVAIKVLRPSVAQRQHAIERFLREARVSAQLSGPHTVRVHDIGELESGLPYMVMEFLDGRDLGALLAAEGALSPARVLPLILDACEALGEAHSLGFVHRDLKPANLFLAHTAGGHEVLKILDFGIAKALLEGDSPSWLTTSNAVIGSAAYMSPEQLIASRDVDLQTDIWALGVVLFQLLTGQLPFCADTAGGMGSHPARRDPLDPGAQPRDPRRARRDRRALPRQEEDPAFRVCRRALRGARGGGARREQLADACWPADGARGRSRPGNPAGAGAPSGRHRRGDPSLRRAPQRRRHR